MTNLADMLHFLQRSPKPDPLATSLWPAIGRAMPILSGLNEHEWQRLEDRMRFFLNHKSITGAHGLEIDQAKLLIIAAQACLPIINLDDTAYAAWQDVVIYPAGFVGSTSWRDSAGLVHEGNMPMSGMARSDGPVLLSWVDARNGPLLDGRNVVIHECAHKLDMMNGAADGFPPLHAEMVKTAWTRAFSWAYADFSTKVAHGVPVSIDPYGAENPAEFFAVMSEYFFELPHLLHTEYPAVYEQLRQFYRQDPGARLPAIGVEDQAL